MSLTIKAAGGDVQAPLGLIQDSTVLSALNPSEPFNVNLPQAAVAKVIKLLVDTENRIPTVKVPLVSEDFESNLENLEVPDAIRNFFKGETVYSVRDALAAAQFMRLDKVSALITCFVISHFYVGSDPKRMQAVQTNFSTGEISYEIVDALYKEHPMLVQKSQ